MSDKINPQDVIDSFQKRQRIVPMLFIILAILLVIIGVFVIAIAASGGNLTGIFATKTATATTTSTATATLPSPTPSSTPTITETPTVTPTSTPSGPFEYVVQEGDNCFDIATKFNVDLLTLLAINNFAGGCPIQPNQTIIIPVSGQQLPTPTSIPSDLPRGTKLQYTIQFGDTLYTIASTFNSTVEDILAQNKDITDINDIDVGDIITIRVNLVTPTPTIQATSTSIPTP